MFQKLREHGLMVADSHLRYALMRNKRMLFMGHYPVIHLLSQVGIAASVIMGVFILLFIGRIAYDMTVLSFLSKELNA